VPLHAVRDGNLVLHQDIPVFCRRLHDRKADLQRRKTPAAAGQHWFAVHQRVKVVGMIIGRKHGVKPHPFQLVEVFGVGAGIGATGPLPGTFVVVEEELQVGNTDVGIPDHLYEFKRVQFSKGAHAPRDHGVPHHSNGHVPTFGVIQLGVSFRGQ
jgi:hypothetical protein